MILLPLAERAARLTLNALGTRSRRLASPVATLHAYDAEGTGSLPPVVLVHGFGASALQFAPAIARLRQHARRVLAVELPGHGFSETPTSGLTPAAVYDAVAHVLDREIHGPAVLVGNSLGGATVLRYALDRPERVRALVLSSPAGAAMDPPDFEAMVATFRIGSPAAARDFLGRLYHRPPWFVPLLARETHEHLSQPRLGAFLDAAAVADLFTPEQLAALQAPTLLVWGRSDRLIPRACLEFYRRHLPGVHVEEPEWAGHCPQVDDPAAFSRLIVDFARRVAG